MFVICALYAQGSFGWNMVDIKAMDPSICKHCMEDDAKPIRQMQHKLNPAMKELVKTEMLKLLNIGIIYPIVDSKWVSPTQVVPKKSRVTIAWNKDGEMLPTCIATS